MTKTGKIILPHPIARFFVYVGALAGLILGYTAFFNTAYAQQQRPKTIQIHRANEVIGLTRQGKQVRKLIGRVHLSTPDLQMFCDSAYQYLQENQIRAFGNIEIRTEDSRVWADSLTYQIDDEISDLNGRVIVETDSTTLFGQEVRYWHNDRKAHFSKDVRLEDPEGILRAQSGWYFEKADSAVFRGHVQVADSSQYIEGDSLFSNRKANHTWLYGSIYGSDPHNRSELGGEYMESDSTGRRLLQDNAYLLTYEKDEPDTTHIQAETILNTSPGDSSQIKSYGNVRIWSPDFSSIADTAIYQKADSTFNLYGHPRAWHEQIQLTAPFISVALSNGQVDQLKAYPRPFAVQQDSATQRFNQIKGDTLTAYFEKGGIRQIYVRPQSHMFYHSTDDSSKSDGAIDLQAVSTRIYFKAGSVNRVVSKQSINGTFIPEEDNPGERRLDGFTWEPKLRPHRPDRVLKRKWPPITGIRPFTLPRRYLESHPVEQLESLPRIGQ